MIEPTWASYYKKSQQCVAEFYVCVTEELKGHLCVTRFKFHVFAFFQSTSIVVHFLRITSRTSKREMTIKCQRGSSSYTLESCNAQHRAFCAHVWRVVCKTLNSIQIKALESNTNNDLYEATFGDEHTVTCVPCNESFIDGCTLFLAIN